MALFMIAVIKNGKDIVGARLLNSTNGDVRDTTINNLMGWLANGGNLANIELKDGEIVGTNGSIDRYTTIDVNKGHVRKTSLVILNRIGDEGFNVADCGGEIKRLTKDKLLEILTKQPLISLANGKVVNGNISVIRGEYDILEIENKQKKSSVGINNKIKDVVNILEISNEIADEMSIENKERAIGKAESWLNRVPAEIKLDKHRIKLYEIAIEWEVDGQRHKREGFAYSEFKPSNWSPSYSYLILNKEGKMLRSEVPKDSIIVKQYNQIKDNKFKEVIVKYIKARIADEVRSVAIDEQIDRINNISKAYEKSYKDTIQHINNEKGILTIRQFKDIILAKAEIPPRYELNIYRGELTLTFFGGYEKYVCDKVSFTYEEYDHNWFMRDIETLDSKSKAEYNSWLKRLSKGKVNFKNCDKQKESLNCGDKFSLNYQHIVVYNINGEYTKEEAERIAAKINSR